MLRLLGAIAMIIASPGIASSPDDAIATASAAVADMERLARTPEDRALAERDRALVKRAGALIAERAVALRHGRPLRDAQMSFNLQYLQLQTQMQNENRSYTTVSNIMKTKHETVKNTLNNVR